MSIWNRLYEQSQSVSVQQQPISALNLNHDLSQSAVINTVASEWVASPAPGVVRVLLERNGGEKTTRATSLVAYRPDSQFDAHVHPLGEEFLVLAGTFSDERGDYPAGTYVRNPPGSSHRPFSREGCLIFVKLQQFLPDDDTYVTQGPDDSLVVIDSSGWQRQDLFDNYENVAIFSTRETSTFPSQLIDVGVEILILEGALSQGGRLFAPGTWLRFSVGSAPLLNAVADTRLFVKWNHLRNAA